MTKNASAQGSAQKHGASSSAPPKRDGKGRFAKGASGNPCGRPRKKPRPPLTYSQHLARMLARPVEITDAEGRVRQGTELERIAENIISQLSTAKPKEALDTLERLKAIEVFKLMELNAGVGLEEYTELLRETLEKLDARNEPYDSSKIKRDHLGRPIKE